MYQKIIKNEKAVKAWNEAHPNPEGGVRVRVTMDLGQTIETTTRSAAWMLGGHSPVIKLAGISGAFLLTRVKAY